MSYIGSTPANKLVTSSDMEDGIVTTAKIANDAATADKIANAVNSAITANTSKTTNATHSGEVTGSGALTIAGNVVDEANLKVSNSPTNGYMLTAQSGNTGGLTWVAAPSGGLSNAQQWRISASQTNMNTNAFITNNWEEADTNGYARIGNAMTQSSGTFTFPVTGIWLIEFTYVGFGGDNTQDYIGAKIQVTTNNSSYAEATEGYNNTDNNQYVCVIQNLMFDVTNTTTHKIKFSVTAQNNGIQAVGNTSANITNAVFTRLGDT